MVVNTPASLWRSHFTEVMIEKPWADRPLGVLFGGIIRAIRNGEARHLRRNARPQPSPRASSACVC